MGRSGGEAAWNISSCGGAPDPPPLHLITPCAASDLPFADVEAGEEEFDAVAGGQEVLVAGEQSARCDAGGASLCGVRFAADFGRGEMEVFFH